MGSVIRGNDDFDSKKAFTQNQSWEDVTSSRAINQPYTNNTDKAISVAINLRHDASSNLILKIKVDGSPIISSDINSFSAGAQLPFSVIVPAGSSYEVDTTQSLIVISWFELR